MDIRNSLGYCSILRYVKDYIRYYWFDGTVGAHFWNMVIYKLFLKFKVSIMKKIKILLVMITIVAIAAADLASNARINNILYFPVDQSNTIAGCKVRVEGYTIRITGFNISYVTTLPGSPCVMNTILTTID